MEIEVFLPSLLRASAGGQSNFRIEAATLADALRLIRERYPQLGIHLYGADGKLRQHVIVFYNGESIRWLDNLDLPLQKGDQIQIVQSVSGG